MKMKGNNCNTCNHYISTCSSYEICGKEYIKQTKKNRGTYILNETKIQQRK